MPPKTAGSPKKDELSKSIKRLLNAFLSYAKPLNKDGSISIKQINKYLDKDNNRETLKNNLDNLDNLEGKTITDIPEEVKNGNPNILVDLGLNVFLNMDRLLEIYPQQQPQLEEETPKKKKKKKKKKEQETPSEPQPVSPVISPVPSREITPSPIISPVPTRERTPSPPISQAQQAREALEQKLTKEYKSYNIDDDKKVSYRVSDLDNILKLQKELNQTVNTSESKQLVIHISGKYTKLAKDNNITIDEVREHVSQHKEEKEGKYRPRQQYISETGRLTSADQAIRADIKREGTETRGEIQRASLATEAEIKKSLDEQTAKLTKEFEQQKESIITEHQNQLNEMAVSHRREMDTLRKKAKAIAVGLKEATTERKTIEEKNIEENKKLREFLSEQHMKEIKEIKANHALTVGVIKKMHTKQIDQLKKTAKEAKEERKKISKDTEQRDLMIAEETKKRDELIAQYNAERQEAIAKAQAEKAELIAKQTEDRDYYMFKTMSTKLNNIDIDIKKSILESETIKNKLQKVSETKERKSSGLDSKIIDTLIETIPANSRSVYGPSVRKLLDGKFNADDIAKGIIGISLFTLTANPTIATAGTMAYTYISQLTGLNINNLFSTSRAISTVKQIEEKRTQKQISIRDKQINELEELIKKGKTERQQQQQRSQQELKVISTLRTMPLVEQTRELSQTQTTLIEAGQREASELSKLLEEEKQQKISREEQIRKLEELIKTQSSKTEQLQLESTTKEQKISELEELLKQQKEQKIKNIISPYNIVMSDKPETKTRRRTRSVPSLIKVTQDLKVGAPAPLPPRQEIKITPQGRMAMILASVASKASPSAIFNYIRDSKASEYVRRVANMIVDNYGSSIAGIPEEAWERAVDIVRESVRENGLPVNEEKVSQTDEDYQYNFLSDLSDEEAKDINDPFIVDPEPEVPSTRFEEMLGRPVRAVGFAQALDSDIKTSESQEEMKEMGATSDIPEETLYQRLTQIVMGVLPTTQSIAERASTAIEYIADLTADQKQRLFGLVSTINLKGGDINMPVFNRAIDLIDSGLGIPKTERQADDVKRHIEEDAKEIKLHPDAIAQGAQAGMVGGAVGAGLSTGSAMGAVSGAVPGALAGAAVSGVTSQLSPILAERLANSGLSATRQARIMALARVLPPSLLGLYMGYTPSGKVADVVGRGVTSGAGITEQKITVTPDVLAKTKAQVDQDPSANKVWQPKAITPTTDILDVPKQEKYIDDIEFIAFNYIPPTSEGAEGTVDTNPLKYQQLLESKIRYTDAGVYVPYVTWSKINDANNISDKRLRTMALGPELPSMKFETFDNETSFENVAKWQYVNSENMAVEFQSPYADFSKVENSDWTNETNMLFTINA